MTRIYTSKRLQAMHASHGVTEGRKCGECRYYVREGMWCMVYVGPSYDWKAEWSACGKFTPRSKYGHSLLHDRAVEICAQSHTVCPFGCARDGGPNCAYNVEGRGCDPALRAAGDFASCASTHFEVVQDAKRAGEPGRMI
jgi:hypothetical protein